MDRFIVHWTISRFSSHEYKRLTFRERNESRAFSCDWWPQSSSSPQLLVAVWRIDKLSTNDSKVMLKASKMSRALFVWQRDVLTNCRALTSRILLRKQHKTSTSQAQTRQHHEWDTFFSKRAVKSDVISVMNLYICFQIHDDELTAVEHSSACKSSKRKEQQETSREREKRSIKVNHAKERRRLI